MTHTRQEVEARKIREYVDRIVAGAPPLTPQQREVIIAAFAGIKTNAPAPPKKSKRELLIDGLLHDVEKPNDLD